MKAATKHAITDALGEMRDGVPGALDRLVPLVYADLSRIAHRQLGLEASGHTLSTTALVHEAYLRLIDQTRARWADRVQFFAVAAHVMRRVLVDHARKRGAQRRGDGAAHLSLHDTRAALEMDQRQAAAPFEDDCVDVLAIDAAMLRLEAIDAGQSRIVELRYFGGLTLEETAEVVGVSLATVKREWSMARAWLQRELTAAHS